MGRLVIHRRRGEVTRFKTSDGPIDVLVERDRGRVKLMIDAPDEIEITRDDAHPKKAAETNPVETPAPPQAATPKATRRRKRRPPQAA